MALNSLQAATAGNERDSTLRLIDWFSIERVRSAKILVVGAGAIGNEVLKNLALLGIGNIFIIDKDTIERSNLTRSVLYRETDCGQPKALVAARAVQGINSNVKARWLVGDVRFDLGLGLIRSMDVVIAGLDNVLARDKLNSLCFTAGRHWIDAGIGVLDGQVCVYSPQRGACYACYYSDKQLLMIQRSCAVIASRFEKEGKVATTPTIASIVAGVQVQEALKLLDVANWVGRTLISRKFSFNGTEGDTKIIDLVKREGCEGHFTIAPELIVKMEGVSAYTTTVSELLDKVEEMVGAPSSIGLNYDLGVELLCKCGITRPLLKPMEMLFREDLQCECGYKPERRTALKLRNTLDRNLINQYPIAIGQAKLNKIGIAPLDIMRVSSEKNYWSQKKRRSKSKSAAPQEHKSLFIELAGDDRPDFHFNEI